MSKGNIVFCAGREDEMKRVAMDLLSQAWAVSTRVWGSGAPSLLGSSSSSNARGQYSEPMTPIAGQPYMDAHHPATAANALMRIPGKVTQPQGVPMINSRSSMGYNLTQPIPMPTAMPPINANDLAFVQQNTSHAYGGGAPLANYTNLLPSHSSSFEPNGTLSDYLGYIDQPWTTTGIFTSGSNDDMAFVATTNETHDIQNQ